MAIYAFAIILMASVTVAIVYAARLQERCNIQILDDGSIVRLPTTRFAADGGSSEGGFGGGSDGGCGGDGGGSCG